MYTSVRTNIRPMNSKQKVPVDDIWISEPVRMVGGEKAVKRYRKIGKVGEGTYSICYLARTSDSGSTYVAKVIPKSKL